MVVFVPGDLAVAEIVVAVMVAGALQAPGVLVGNVLPVLSASM